MRAIAAMGPNRVIGLNGGLPWKPIREDFRWFKKFTMGQTLIMGRTTFETLPELPGRDIVVLSNTIDYHTEYQAKWREKCRNLYLRNSVTFNVMDWPNSIVAGGAKTYHNLLPLCNEVFMTHVIDDYEGDTYIPHFEHQFPNSEVLREAKDHWIVRYWR